MNFGTTSLIALVLLIVAVEAQYRFGKGILPGSVRLLDSDSDRTVGAINFWQSKTSLSRIYMYCNIWDIPDGMYVAVVHECIGAIAERCHLGPARAQINQVGDVTKGRQPMTLFRRVFNGSTGQSFTGFATGLSLNPLADDNITGSYIAIYRDTPAGMKLCSPSQNKTAAIFASGYVKSTLIGSATPKMPSMSDFS